MPEYTVTDQISRRALASRLTTCLAERADADWAIAALCHELGRPDESLLALLGLADYAITLALAKARLKADEFHWLHRLHRRLVKATWDQAHRVERVAVEVWQCCECMGSGLDLASHCTTCCGTGMGIGIGE